MQVRAQDDDVPALLRAWRAGQQDARDRLFAILYNELEQSAAALLRNERHVSLSMGDLLHEAILRLIALEQIDWRDRAHFLALTSVMMRRALVDHVRAKRSIKREHQKVELVTSIPDVPNTDLEEVNDALDRLATIDQERAQIVEMRYFGGMEITDIAHVLGLSESTVKRRWQTARLWLFDALKPQLD